MSGFFQCTLLTKSRDSSVGIALGYGLDYRSSIPGGAGNFSLHHRVQNDSESGALSLGVKRQVREADHSPPSSGEVK
jgi:hypothetical protein